MAWETRSAARRGALGPFLAVIYTPAVVLLAVLGVVSRVWNVPEGNFTRDPLQLEHLPVYLGLTSYVGILVWCAAATIGFMSAAVLPDSPALRTTRSFLLWTGVLTLWITLDDLFMFHDIVIPQLTHVREQIIYLLYAAIAIWFARRFKEQLREDRLLLALIVILAVASIAMDNGHAVQVITGRALIPQSYLVEDGMKLLAQVGWFGYVVRRASAVLRAEMRSAAA